MDPVYIMLLIFRAWLMNGRSTLKDTGEKQTMARMEFQMFYFSHPNEKGIIK
jgi:hypothetical protein